MAAVPIMVLILRSPCCDAGGVRDENGGRAENMPGPRDPSLARAVLPSTQGSPRSEGLGSRSL